MFRKRKLSDDYSGIIKQIREGERRVPQHRHPKTIRDMGFESFITPAHEIVFDDFRWFAAILNRNVSEPWSIEELPDTLIRDLESEYPDLGRRYRVHFNACEMGTLQVTPTALSTVARQERISESPMAEVLIELNYLRFVPFEHALSLLSAIGLFLGRFGERDAAYAAASVRSHAALAGYLWETVRVEDQVIDFTCRVEGPYELLRETTQHWIANGIDPFERWNGDR